MNQHTSHNSILLFDGYCNLCSSTVQYILNHEKDSAISFASLQSDKGIELLNYYNINTADVDSIVFIESEKAYIKSTAALKISKHLKGLFPAMQVFLIVPPFIRNAVYDFIAKNRYKWYGKSDTCMFPPTNVSHRFL